MRNIVRSGVAAVVAIGLIVVAPVPALAVKPPTPPAVVQVEANATDFTLTVAYSVSRSKRQIVQSNCEIFDVVTEVSMPTSCGPVAERGSTGKKTSYVLSLSVTTASDYEFRVAFTLSDGTVASGSDAFVIEPGRAVAFEVSGLQNQVLYGSRPVPSQLVVVEALDEYGNRASGYDGTVTFDGGDFPEFEELPSNSTLSNGRGVFPVKVLASQNDCFYGDIAPPDCAGYWRITATDTADPTITDYQRVTITVVIDNLPTNFITPEGGVCPTCAPDPADAVVIDLNHPVILSNVLALPIGSWTGTLEGVTSAGSTFTASVSGTALVGHLGNDLSVIVPTSGITTNIALQSLDSVESQFGTVKLEVPYDNPTIGQNQPINVYTTLFNFSRLACLPACQ